MDYKDLPLLGKIQFCIAVFLMLVGLIVIFAGLYQDIVSGNFTATPNLLSAIINHLSSTPFTSGLSIFGIGLALVSIAFSNIE